ncbi:hypothetical protein B0H13DRAFT_1894646 [Mycena leptocephala]|nr:hypothetical protein B0H13DRAFT_1894646 [Mycena leptocephala]
MPVLCLSNSLENLGVCLRALGCHKESLSWAQEAVDLQRRLIATDPVFRVFFLSAVGNAEDAVNAARESVDIYRSLPDRTDGLEAGLARDLRSVGLHEDALRAEGQSAHLYQTVTQTRPALLGPHVKSLQSLAEDLHVLGRAEDAARTDAELADVEAMRSLEQIPKN